MRAQRCAGEKVAGCKSKGRRGAGPEMRGRESGWPQDAVCVLSERGPPKPLFLSSSFFQNPRFFNFSLLIRWFLQTPLSYVLGSFKMDAELLTEVAPPRALITQGAFDVLFVRHAAWTVLSTPNAANAGLPGCPGFFCFENASSPIQGLMFY